ncbi:MAG TPA: YciI family protein [Mycobacteriales bacterium]|nr:YciI family protein [Mycobacteriales bacterium]
MADWIYFIHPPRDEFAATMTDEERAVWAAHFSHLQSLAVDGRLILAGPTLGTVNTGVCVFEADDEPAARAVMESDPAIASGIGTGELRGFRASLLRGRDDPPATR